MLDMLFALGKICCLLGLAYGAVLLDRAWGDVHDAAPDRFHESVRQVRPGYGISAIANRAEFRGLTGYRR